MMALFVLLLVFLVQFGQSCNLKDLRLLDWAEKRVKSLGGCRALSGGAKPVSYSVPNVKIFLYHSDEDEVVADFLQYHSYVFGSKNIVVIDQDSQIKSVCETLALFQYCGTKVITTKGSFLDKGKMLTKEMRKHKHTLLVPLDTDEFIFPFAPGSTREVEVNRDALWKAFKELPIDGRKYKFQYYTSAQPNASTCLSSPTSTDPEFRRVFKNNVFFPMFPSGPITKTFFHSHGFTATDDGNHFGYVKRDKYRYDHPAIAANLSHYFIDLKAQMVHYVIGGYRGARDKYTRAAVRMGFNSDSNCSESRIGMQYCEPCKLFVNGTDHGIKYYTDACTPYSPPHTFVSTVVSDWFDKHARSMLQLTGG